MAAGQYIDSIRLGGDVYDIKDTGSHYIDKNVTDLEYYTKTNDLPAVARTGSYNSLLDKPNLPQFLNSSFVIQTRELDNGGGEVTTSTTFWSLQDQSDPSGHYGGQTATIDLRNYVLKTSLPLPSSSGRGCIGLSAEYGFALAGANSNLQVQALGTISAYNSKPAACAISKGTLETVLADRSYISANNFATASIGGTLKLSANYATDMATTSDGHGGTVSTGELIARIISFNDYANLSNQAFISKGTLTNVLTGNGFINNEVNDLVNYTLTSALPSVALSGNYNDLINKPTIPTVNDAILTIQKNNANVGTFSANASQDSVINITVPTTTNELTNNSGFIVASDVATCLTTITDYNPSATQTLKNVNGVLKWVPDNV